MEVDIPLGWKPLNIEQYDGTTDPYEHLDIFLTQVNLYTNDDAILCRVFLTQVRALHTPDDQSHYNPWGGLQHRGTYKITSATSSQLGIRHDQIL